MLVFIVPLKSAQKSSSWESVCALFQRCLQSICNQTCPDFRVIVVCNEKPAIAYQHPQIEYVQVEFPEPKEDNPIAWGLTDKGRKVLKGLVAAQAYSPTHTMTVDADDCVSCRLAAYIRQHPEANGWYLRQGYKYIDTSDFLYLKRREFYRMTGTANILRYDLNEIPPHPEWNRGCGYYKFHINHQKIKAMMAERGTPLKPLPFPGAVYILGTGENMSGNEGNVSFSWLNRKRLTPKLAQEFGLRPAAVLSDPSSHTSALGETSGS